MDRHGALERACAAHAGQLDKSGRPYILHPVAVAAMVAGIGEDYEVAALLHDVIEDTDVELRDLPLSRAQESAVAALTREDGEVYADYVGRVTEDRIAPVVKLADILHNQSPKRRVPGLNLDSRYDRTRERILADASVARELATMRAEGLLDGPRQAWLVATLFEAGV